MPLPPKYRFHVLLRDEKNKFPDAPEEDGMKLIGSYIPDGLPLAVIFLEGELNVQYGMDWFLNAHTDCYQTFTDHTVVGRIKKVLSGQ